MDGVVTLHETIHEIHRKKKNGIILKLDFEKAYDKVFLLPGAPGYNKYVGRVNHSGVVPHLVDGGLSILQKLKNMDWKE
ncbi:hypothetical protein ACJX0J_042408, partial [Zea mays]